MPAPRPRRASSRGTRDCAEKRQTPVLPAVARRVFDGADLITRVDELAQFLAAAEKAYDVGPGNWIAVGFANGANMASALLLRRPDTLARAVLLAAMVPFQAPARRQSQR